MSTSGMSYQTQDSFHGWTLHFGLRNGQLIIRKENAKECDEFIHAKKFSDDIPRPLSITGSQWLDLNSGRVRFHQNEKWWQDRDSSDNWILEKTQSIWNLTKGSRMLLDIYHRTHKLLAGFFSPLEETNYTITTLCDDKEIQIDLPRYRLQFSCNNIENGRIDCRTHPGWIVDRTQSVGTLIGLRNYLKLRDAFDLSTRECILVPLGNPTVNFNSSSNHQSVSIQLQPGPSRSYTVYTIDHSLNRLTDNHTLHARFYRIYLHALTSSILPDPFTGKTGTAVALEELQAAGSYSFQDLDPICEDLLNEIATLTPSREYYRGIKSMQTVTWSSEVPIWTQNDDFHPFVLDIINFWNRKRSALIGTTSAKISSIGVDKLLERARNRSSCTKIGDPRQSHRRCADRIYHMRHHVSDRELLAHDLSQSSIAWQPKIFLQFNLEHMFSGKRLLATNESAILEFCPSWAEMTHSAPPINSWNTIYELCRQARYEDRYELAFLLSFWAYRDLGTPEFFRALLAIAIGPSFNTLPVPRNGPLDLSAGTKPINLELRSILGGCMTSFEDSHFSELRANYQEPEDALYRRRRSDYESAVDRELNTAVDMFTGQWPTKQPRVAGLSNFQLLQPRLGLESIRRKFETWYHNLEFFEHLSQVASALKLLRTPKVLNTHHFVPISAPEVASLDSQHHSAQYQPYTLSSLSSRDQEIRCVSNDVRFDPWTPFDKPSPDENSFTDVEKLISRLKLSSEPFANQYADDLDESIRALEKYEVSTSLTGIDITMRELHEHRKEAERSVGRVYSKIREAFSPRNTVEHIIQASGLWPDITKLDFIKQLSLGRRQNIPSIWIKQIVKLGEYVTWHQRCKRLLNLAHNNLVQDFEREARNTGRMNWNPEENIDWLLLELDGDLLIRRVQAEIARAMMSNDEPENLVMQLNMGEGKSAVIVPAVAASLADTTKLVGSVVLKPLSTQMFQILARTLSGLCDRIICELPFSRATRPTTDMVRAIRDIYEDCMAKGSIILTLPEYILSFKLMGIERMAPNEAAADRLSVAKELVQTQSWLNRNARDILDESDEILHIRYQLIYTIGEQTSLDGGIDRWTLIQELLDIVQEKAITISRSNGRSSHTPIEVGGTDGTRYRSIRVIDRSVGEKMLHDIVQELLTTTPGMIPSLSSSLNHLKVTTKHLILEFVTDRSISYQKQEQLFAECPEHAFQKQLLLLRGLIADGVLLFILMEKRYRVDYGLDLRRGNMNLAVPYRAKDRPAVKAEFGHADVMLELTCLTYYYGGLSDKCLASCFDALLKTSEADIIYESWVQRSSNQEVPSSLSRLDGINFKDKKLLKKVVFPFFRFNKLVIDFYLSTLVFPREAKGFELKLSTSGWDLAEIRSHKTTGFSGTNDNRYLLPMTVKQSDLPSQAHTNSLVLRNILKSENQHVVRAQDKDGMKLSAQDMIQKIVAMEPKVQVLLDVGAQILELTNIGVARAWLAAERSEKILGAVFFDGNDQLLVLRRDGKLDSFASSPLSQQLDKVLVYLDEAHTRGTDIKLPIGSRAAVTLGPNLPKDKFAQGCMRMRKLGNGHSLVFLVPPEIYAKIQADAKKGVNENVTVLDILTWTMLEGCRQVQNGFAVWADQGLQYLKRKQAWDSLDTNETREYEAFARKIQDRETRPLLEMYGVDKGDIDLLRDYQTEGIDTSQITSRLTKFNASSKLGSGVQEEQEREVDHEVELEKDVERPPAAKPAIHRLAPEIEAIVRTGNFNRHSQVAYGDAFATFQDTSARNLFQVEGWQSELFASKDFATTINKTRLTNTDDYLRPVRWILSVNNSPELLILSPYEANELIPLIRESDYVRLHCYIPRFTRSTATFEFLDFCPVTSLPQEPDSSRIISNRARTMLNLFAGQVFFFNEEAYQQTLEFLGIHYGTIPDEDMVRRRDCWLSQEEREVLGLQKSADLMPFTRSPIDFVAEITRMRRKGQGFASTHLGAIVHARPLQAADFQ